MKVTAAFAWLGLTALAGVDSRPSGEAQHSADRMAAPTPAGRRIEITRAGTLPATSAPAEHFAGAAQVVPLFRPNDPLHVAASSVRFEPGARTAWHSHPLGQVLIVTAGVGWVQQWGGPSEMIQPGDVVRIPPGVKHWHGATATDSLTHIAIVEPLDGKTVEWMEQVGSDQYGGPRR